MSSGETLPGFVFFFGWEEDFADFPDATRLELFDAIVAYAKTGETPPLSHDSALIFRAIRREIDAYAKKRDALAEKRREWGKLGGRPRKNLKVSEEPQGFDDGEESSENLKVFEKPIKEKKRKENERKENVVENACACAHAREGGAETPLPLSTTAGTKTKRAVTADSIARFLNAYPAKHNGMRNEMFDIWERDGLLERESEIMAGLERWKTSQAWSNERYIPHAMRFLEESWWRISPPERASAPERNSGESEADELRRLGFRVS